MLCDEDEHVEGEHKKMTIRLRRTIGLTSSGLIDAVDGCAKSVTIGRTLVRWRPRLWSAIDKVVALAEWTASKVLGNGKRRDMWPT